MSIFEEKRKEGHKTKSKYSKKFINAHVMMISEETESELGEISMVNGWSSGLHRTYIK